MREEQQPVKRFSRALVLSVLDERAARIAAAQKFDRNNGTSQLRPSGESCAETYDQIIKRAVEYGRMLAFEQFAEAIEEGFRFEPHKEST